MFDEQRKISKIMAELTMFFLSVGADQIHSTITKAEGNDIITFHANYNPENEKELDALHCLNEQRNDGIEDIYWELAGSGNYGETSELLLVGMMVDKAEVQVENGFVNLTLYKGLES